MPANPFLRLLRILAGAGRDDLRRQVQYLKAENEILRAKIKGPVRVTAKERFRLAKLAKPLGSALRSIVSIAQPETVMRWIREADRKRPKKRPGVRRAGRPRTPEDVRRVVLRIARETGWGYTRILGELKNLHIKVSRSTVVNILREAGLPTAPERGERTWEEFIASHAKTLWACDFVQQRVLTLRGFRDAFLLVFVNVATRRAIATTSTEHPDAAWVAEQVARFKAASGMWGARGTACRVLTRDRDQKFGRAFDGALRAEGITPVRLPHCAPNLNAHVERFIQTLQVECLDRFIVAGTGHLDLLMREFVEHYNQERPHSSIGHRPPAGRAPPLRIDGRDGPIRCRTRLGGVLRHYYRMAA